MATASSQCQRGAPHRNGLSSSRVNNTAEPRLAPRAAQLMCWRLLVVASLLADRLQQHRTPSRVPRMGSNPAPGCFAGRGRSAGRPVSCGSRSPILTARAAEDQGFRSCADRARTRSPLEVPYFDRGVGFVLARAPDGASWRGGVVVGISFGRTHGGAVPRTAEVGVGPSAGQPANRADQHGSEGRRDCRVGDRGRGPERGRRQPATDDFFADPGYATAALE
jgi:hypothetical protein